MVIRKRQVSKNDWRLDELDEDGFKSKKGPNLDAASRGTENSLKMSSILPDNARVESVGSSAMAPAHELHVSEPANADAQSLQVQRAPNSLGGGQSVLDLRLQRHVEGTWDPSPQLVPSFGRRRDSMPSRLRRWFGQQRAVQPSLLLHGLREMPWDCQLCGVAAVSEMTLIFLLTTLGPGYVQGVVLKPCQFDFWGAFLWKTPLAC
eukprot:s1389_g9.t1